MIQISFLNFIAVLAGQLAAWYIVWALVCRLDDWRKRRAEARGERAGHFNELVIVAAAIFMLFWSGLYFASLAGISLRPPGPPRNAGAPK